MCGDRRGVEGLQERRPRVGTAVRVDGEAIGESKSCQASMLFGGEELEVTEGLGLMP